MTEVYLEYDPYRPVTNVIVEGEPVAANSRLFYKNRPFQEWIDGFPQDLQDECGDDQFCITFRGPSQQFITLQSVAKSAEAAGVYMTCEVKATEVFLEHNPYKPLTMIELEGEAVAANSALNYRDRPFQEWVDGLPVNLWRETGNNKFYIFFHGTVLDYEDLQSAATGIWENGNRSIIQCLFRHPATRRTAVVTVVTVIVFNGPLPIFFVRRSLLPAAILRRPLSSFPPLSFEISFCLRWP